MDRKFVLVVLALSALSVSTSVVAATGHTLPSHAAAGMKGKLTVR